MSGTRISVAPLLLLLAAAPALAQDQTIVVNTAASVCAAIGDASSASISQANAPALIAQSLGIEKPADGTSYILHVVRYVDGEATVDQAHWYVYSSDWVGHSGAYWLVDPRINSHFTGTRIFGSHQVGLAYLHHNIPAISRRAAIQAVTAQRVAAAAPPTGSDAELAAAIDADRRQLDQDYEDVVRVLQRRADGKGMLAPDALRSEVDALKRADLQTSLPQERAPAGPRDLKKERVVVRAALDAERTVYGLLLGRETPLDVTDDATGQRLARLNDSYLTTESFAALGSLTYRIEVTKKTPAPIANLQDAVAIALPNAARNAATLDLNETVSVCGGRAFEVKPLPSDMAVTAKFTGSDGNEHQIAKLTFDNEKKYHYDVSFALPLKSYTDLTYETTNGIVTAKTVNKGDLFVAINLSLVPFDTKRAQAQLIPVFLYGMPITGTPLKHHLVGLAIGLNRVQLWGGWVINQVENAPDPAAPDRAPGSTWKASPSFGINFSVQTVKALFSK